MSGDGDGDSMCVLGYGPTSSLAQSGRRIGRNDGALTPSYHYHPARVSAGQSSRTCQNLNESALDHAAAATVATASLQRVAFGFSSADHVTVSILFNVQGKGSTRM